MIKLTDDDFIYLRELTPEEVAMLEDIPPAQPSDFVDALIESAYEVSQ